MTATLPRPSLPNPADFAHVREWVFDLDNTLYPHRINLFAQIDRNMTAFVANLLGMDPVEAKTLQKRYYHDHGTTLKGLMLHHNADPNAFLEAAHAIDYSVVPADPELGDMLKALPGRKFILTNGTVAHAQDTARALGILDHFDDIFDIVAADYVPKPAGATYDKFMAMHRIDTTRAAMFEDLPRNLLVPEVFETGFVEAWEKAGEDDDHIGYMTHDLKGFLRAVL